MDFGWRHEPKLLPCTRLCSLPACISATRWTSPHSPCDGALALRLTPGYDHESLARSLTPEAVRHAPVAAPARAPRCPLPARAGPRPRSARQERLPLLRDETDR